MHDEPRRRARRQPGALSEAWRATRRHSRSSAVALFLKGEYRVTQRAAWIVKHCADEHAELVVLYFNRMIDRMLEPGVHVAVKRNVIRILQDVEIPRRLAGKIATVCFELFGAAKEPIAVKVFSMTVLANIARQEPELKNEIRILIEQQMPTGSAGFRSRGMKIVQQLDKL